jgi:diaminohydroxyphosphoribosylaminopyrimidine deaminase/5-amino-6-(5-phosphoribosylamino)uracil reductase
MHKQYLLTALEQALLGRGACAPNPSVGAVAVRNNTIIAQAWHRGAGTLHAEPLVLHAFPAKTPEVTLYVTLEPCNHHGRTPPCVDAIIRHGISRVVYAHQDPNPVVLSGDTPERLRQHGIEVLQITVPEIERFYQSYDYWTATNKPWVTAKIAQSFDGKIAGVGQVRMALSNDACAAFTHQQRLATDVILTTSKTISVDNPWLTARVNDTITAKPIAILDTQLGLSHDLNVFKTAKHCHIYHNVLLGNHAEVLGKKSHNSLDLEASTCSYHGIKRLAHGLDLHAVMSHLGSLGYHDVWVEAGGELFSALHREKLVNRTYVYLVPQTLGPNATPAYLCDDVLLHPRSVHWHPKDDNLIAELEWD